jgi:hypothetical protein
MKVSLHTPAIVKIVSQSHSQKQRPAEDLDLKLVVKNRYLWSVAW